MELGERFCLYVDMMEARRFDLPAIQVMGSFAQRNSDTLDRRVAALVIVAPSAMVRGAIRVLFTIKTPGHPYAVVRNREEADAYIAAQLESLRAEQVHIA